MKVLLASILCCLILISCGNIEVSTSEPSHDYSHPFIEKAEGECGVGDRCYLIAQIELLEEIKWSLNHNHRP